MSNNFDFTQPKFVDLTFENNFMLKQFIISLFFLFSIIHLKAQNNWPSVDWDQAVNLTGVMSATGINEASGLFWNKQTERLYLVQNNGRIRVLQYQNSSNTFTQLANKSISGGPEGVTMVNLDENVFYTIDEDDYEIRKYTHTTDFNLVSLSRSWNLLGSPSTMPNTGNTGPEGICFIPDSFLMQAEFVNQLTGQAYVSQKGMGGLIFIAHQNEGYIWVFDINPNVSNDFLFVGKYKTNRSESCDLSFDQSTGLLYILHNIDGNRLEVTTLNSTIIGTDRKLNMVNEYFLPSPSGNINIEGFTLTEKCPTSNQVSAWLCRDVSNSDGSTLLTDALRWFSPFVSDGDCEALSLPEINDSSFSIYPNPTNQFLYLEENLATSTVEIFNSMGQKVKFYLNDNKLDVSELQGGLYFLTLKNDSTLKKARFIKF